MRAPTVSVVIPVHNHFDDLVFTLSSIQSQTYGNFEILIGDDGSTEDIEGLVKGLGDDRIRFFPFKEKQRIGRTRNIPMRYAEGLYIAFCDPGDTWEPEKLDRQIKFMSGNPAVLLSWTNGRIGEDELYYESPVYIKRDPVETLIVKNPVITSTAILRREILQVTGLFHERIPRLPEYALWLRIATLGSVHYDYEPTANLAQSDLSTIVKAEERIKALDDFTYWAPKKHHKDLALLHIKRTQKEYAKFLAKEGKVKGAFRAWLGKGAN